MSEELVMRKIPEIVLDDIYCALLDTEERLPNGTALIRRCLNYMEQEQGYLPPKKWKGNYPKEG